MSKESSRRLVGVVILAWFAVLGFDFFLHGGLLAGLYVEPSPFLLPPEDAFRLIPVGYLAFLVFEIFLVWLMVRLDVKGWRSGGVFGLQVGAFTWGALVLGLLSISTASVALIVGWFVGQTVEAGIGGMVAGAGLTTDRPWRLAVYVIIFVVVAIVVTVVLQSVGLAPTMRVTEKMRLLAGA
jgi:tryptophan-rich sensory protein